MLVEKELYKFGKAVIKQARTRLTKTKKNASKSLYKSLDYDLKVSKNSFSLSFEMENYGKFIDRGVKGSESSKKAPRSPYKYTTKMPPTKALDKWVVRRGIAGRNKKGQFIKRDTLKYLIARSIFLKGIETTNFFTRPFELAFKKLPEELTEAYGLDVEKFLKFTIND